MSDDNATSSVQDRYAPQFAQELARNEQEQKELEARLAQLRDDHTALSGMLAALGHETTPNLDAAATPATVTDDAKAAGESLPKQRGAGKKAGSATAPAQPKRAKKAAGGAKKNTTAKKPATTAKKAAAGTATKAPAKTATKTAAKAATKAAATTAETDAKPSASTAKKSGAAKAVGGPTLQDVISGLLDGHSPERRTVREIFDELKQKHPERASSTQSVRNALNGLLRKGAIEREEKQGAVWFGTPANAASAAAATPPAPADVAPVEPAEEKTKAAAEA